MQKWIDNLKTVEDENIRLAIMTANNHYAGFGPGTANILSEYVRVARGQMGRKRRGWRGPKTLRRISRD
jgi:hypothetical protein